MTMLRQVRLQCVPRWMALTLAPLALFSLLLLPAYAATAERAAGEATPDRKAAEPAFSAQRAQHLASLGVDAWHKAGTRGQGVKIAVLDSGFRGYKTFLGKALPKKITVQSFRADGNLEAKN